MWYRIELNKDRSVRTCVEVSGSLNEGRSVHYVEADSKASAISLLAARWDVKSKHDKDYRNNRVSSGSCASCGKPSQGRSRCDACLKRANDRQRRVRAGLHVPVTSNRPSSAEEKAKSLLLRAQKDRIRSAAARFKCTNYSGIKAQRALYKRALETFDASTEEEFRAWLVAKISECQDKIEGKKPIADHFPQAAE